MLELMQVPTRLDSIVMMAVDWFHMISILAFLIAICWTKNCSGISGKSQLLYAIVFIMRYQNIMWNPLSVYHVIMKVAYTSITCFSVLLVYYFYKETYNKKDDDFSIRRLLYPCAALALLMSYDADVIELLWTFSIYLETVAMLPQICFIEKTKRFDKIVGFYMAALLLSKAAYVYNSFRNSEPNCHAYTTMCCGVVQVLLFLDFFLSQFVTYFFKSIENPAAPEIDTRCLNNEVINIADSTDETKSAANYNQLYSIVLTPETLLHEDKVNLLPVKENITKY